MEQVGFRGILEKIDDYRYRIPRSYKQEMLVPGLIYADEEMLALIKKDNTPLQVANVACLPGIVKYSLAMPDIHWGYGLPIGGVAATDIEHGGVISPGGVGSDINCGVRLVRTNLSLKDLKDKLPVLINSLFHNIPSGVGSKGMIRLSTKEEVDVLVNGSKWAVAKGYGVSEDLVHTEEGGALPMANPDNISHKAMERGLSQLGTLGSGNHFLEVQEVTDIYEPEIAKVFGLEKGQITVMIHSGSRGLGYQVCEDYLRTMGEVAKKYEIFLPDRQLACAPFTSPEGKIYFGAMVSAANYAWANRQCLMHLTREVFKQVFEMKLSELGMELVYDVTHNIGKIEEHIVDGKKIKLCVHRKGATRAFPANHPVLPEDYKAVGQPVIVPGDMGRASYVLVGTQLGMEETFGTACHGAGRVMSRTAAIKQSHGRAIARELGEKGIIVRSAGRETLAEEMPEAYKDVTQVVNVLCNAGIAKRVAKLRPLGVIKG
ncbi:MAG: RtcB family protein [Nitrospirota bacterium]